MKASTKIAWGRNFNTNLFHLTEKQFLDTVAVLGGNESTKEIANIIKDSLFYGANKFDDTYAAIRAKVNGTYVEPVVAEAVESEKTETEKTEKTEKTETAAVA